MVLQIRFIIKDRAKGGEPLRTESAQSLAQSLAQCLAHCLEQ